MEGKRVNVALGGLGPLDCHGSFKRFFFQHLWMASLESFARYGNNQLPEIGIFGKLAFFENVAPGDSTKQSLKQQLSDSTIQKLILMKHNEETFH